jgi:HD-like signal output (HDOD) protein
MWGGMSDFLRNLRAVIERGQDLPTLPEMVLRLHAALEDEHSGAARVAAIIERDPALTARLLRVVNSVAYARGGNPIVSVTEAVARLGIRQVWGISTALSVVRAFPDRGKGLDHRLFWAHCAAVGATSQLLWREAKLRGPATPEDLYVAGLLHDVGLLVLEQRFFDQFVACRRAVAEDQVPLYTCETRLLGMDHGEVGGLLLGRWNLPEAIGAAVAHHHHPDEAPRDLEPLARCLHAAELFCTAVGIGLTEEALGQVSVAEALGALKVLIADTTTFTERLRQVALDARQFVALD